MVIKGVGLMFPDFRRKRKRTKASVSPVPTSPAPPAASSAAPVEPPALVVTVDTESVFGEEPRVESAPKHRLKVIAELLDTLEPKGALTAVSLYKHHIQLFPHQINAALRVISKMGGRAILADEVGLGKTIEAGIVMKELLSRGLVESVLILTPASLVQQWRGELEDKFDEAFITH